MNFDRTKHGRRTHDDMSDRSAGERGDSTKMCPLQIFGPLDHLSCGSLNMKIFFIFWHDYVPALRYKGLEYSQHSRKNGCSSSGRSAYCLRIIILASWRQNPLFFPSTLSRKRLATPRSTVITACPPADFTAYPSTTIAGFYSIPVNDNRSIPVNGYHTCPSKVIVVCPSTDTPACPSTVTIARQYTYAFCICTSNFPINSYFSKPGIFNGTRSLLLLPLSLSTLYGACSRHASTPTLKPSPAMLSPMRNTAGKKGGM